MVVFVKNITIPPNTYKDTPLEETIELEGEILDTIEILVPWGVNAIAGVAIFYGNYQLTPKPDGEYIVGNGETIRDPIKFELPEGKTTLKIKAFNESTSYNHTLYLRFIVLKKEEAKPETVFSEVKEMLRKILFGW